MEEKEIDFEKLDVFYLLKIKKGKPLSQVFEKESGKYTVVRNDLEYYNEAKDNFYTVVMLFDDNDGKKNANVLKIAFCEKISKTNIFKFKILEETDAYLKIKNFLKLILNDLDDDYKYNSYLTKEYAVEIFKDFYFSIRKEKEHNEEIIKDYVRKEFGDRKQHDENAIKMYNSLETERREFQRDRDRIIHSKANRRLVDKAQIFTSSKGDHYRTRMTHTIEVTQIARSIARRLDLNEDLTEAIALGHDLGHTPFGHQGERTLDEILSGGSKMTYKGKSHEIDSIHIIKNINEINDLKQRFKHNFQALRILTLLENKYSEYTGLNLSYQVMEGIWKHTNIHAKKDEIQFNLSDFFKYKQEEKLFPQSNVCSTLEGQVVAIADEIAQRSHDIDDAFKAHKMTHESFMKYVEIKKVEKLKKINTDIIKKLDKMKSEGTIFVDINDMYRSQISSKIIDLLINDVVEKTKENFTKGEIPSDNIYEGSLVEFSDDGKMTNDLLESVISRQVINSSEVARFDKTASRIIYELFKFYYGNPLCLKKTTLIRIYKEMSLKYKNCINFTNSDLKLIRDEIDKITNLDLCDKENVDIMDEYLGKRKILVRCIADHIGGMTDTFALTEYHKLYNRGY